MNGCTTLARRSICYSAARIKLKILQCFLQTRSQTFKSKYLKLYYKWTISFNNSNITILKNVHLYPCIKSRSQSISSTIDIKHIQLNSSININFEQKAVHWNSFYIVAHFEFATRLNSSHQTTKTNLNCNLLKVWYYFQTNQGTITTSPDLYQRIKYKKYLQYRNIIIWTRINNSLLQQSHTCTIQTRSHILNVQ